jgi:SAM-dependent methyltransferase
VIARHLACWCGTTDLSAFSPGYLRCGACGTLVSTEMPDADIAHVVDEERDFYGRGYWLSHQESLGFPTIYSRARSDLPERCLYWLRALLRHREPPARVLEIGAGHGGFVALLRWAGFDATGVEVSPWVVDFARETFGVPMLLGPVEDQPIDAASLDTILLMDVVEHLRDPLDSLRHCLGLLKTDGMLMIQTPCFPDDRSYEDMVARNDRFLETLQPKEHLFLFSRRSILDLLGRLGISRVTFEPALFAQYDMFLTAGPAPAPGPAAARVEELLSGSPAGRMVQALVDLGREVDTLVEQNRAAEADRAARLAVIEGQGRRLGEVEGERNDLRAEVSALRGHLEVAEADRAARLEVIQQQGRRLGEVEAEVTMQQEQLQALVGQLRALQRVVAAIQHGRAYRLLRRLGFWKWFDRAIAQTATDSSA